MLPSSGLFKDIDCPHYDDICGRPYCHFRHRLKKKAIPHSDSAEDSADNSNSSSNDVPTYKPTPKSQLASARGHLPISYVPDLVIRPERSSNCRPPITIPTIEYKPTPKSILSSAANVVDAYVPVPVSTVADKARENVAEVNVDNIDLEDLDTEFGLIDEILSDGSFVEEKAGRVDVEIVVRKAEDVKKKSNSSSSSKKHSKDSKKDKERCSKDKSGSSSKNKRKERDKSSSSKNSSKDNRDKDKPKDPKVKQSNKSSTSKSKDKISSNSKSKDKNPKSGKDKRKSINKSSSKSSHNSDSKMKSQTSSKPKNTPEETLEILLNSNENDQDMNNDFEEDIDVDDDEEQTLEEECYRIFNEYKPTPIAELDKKPPADEKYVPEDITTLGKKRVAYENAERMTTNRLAPAADRIKPIIPSPAQAMLNRMKQARLAQSNNEQSNIIMELKRQQEELRLKRGRENCVDESKISGSKVPKVEHVKLSAKEERVSKLSNMVQAGASLQSANLNGRDLIVANKIKNRIAHQQQPPPPPPTNSNVIDDILNGRSKPRKIAPVMNVNSIQRAKQRVDELKSSQGAKTPAQTIFKTPRVAHVPDYSLSELPDVTHAAKSKLPVNVRTRYLTMFAAEAVKLYLSREDAYQRAISAEDKCYERCSALPTYRNCAMLAINRLRKEAKERDANGLGPIESGGDEGDEVRASDGVLGGERLYGLLEKYRLNGEDIELHGFPMASSEPGRAQIKQKSTSVVPLPANQRLCARCKKVYLIDKRGFPQYEEECIYHSLKKRTLRGDRTYLCCKSPDDTGCVTSNTHVSEVSQDRVLMGYQTTLPPSNATDPRNHSIYALDCEMCYTTIGLELTRVTIVDPQMKTVYESLVKPLNSILDYNTQFSGITRDQMERTSTNILQVQANILHLCNSNTLLIGHSLESDLKALKIIHGSVIDTSVMFPHKFGLPHKRALKALASDYLRKIIQNSVSGHDSAEDALTCMELVMWRVKEDLKVKGISSTSASSTKNR